MYPSRNRPLIPGYYRKRRRRVFTPDEDEALRKLVSELGENNWAEVAAKMEGRNVRQCRDRWREYIRPSLKHSEWTQQEDQIILEKYAELGARWSAIGAFLPDRAELQIKNRWRQLAKKVSSYPVACYPVQWYPVSFTWSNLRHKSSDKGFFLRNVGG